MSRRYLDNLAKFGDILPSEQLSDLRLPAVPAALYDESSGTRYIRPYYGVGAVNTVRLVLTDCPITVDDSDQGGYLKLADFPAGLFKVKGGYGSLQFTTTSDEASTLNTGKSLLWSLGTAAHSTVTLAGAEGNVIPAAGYTTAGTNVASTASVGKQTKEVLIGSAASPADLYLNIAVPTAGDIDADATVTVDGTIILYVEDLGATTSAGNASRMCSAAIWQDCPWDAIKRGEVDGIAMFDDMVGNFEQETNQAAGVTVTTKKSVNQGGWCAFTDADASSTITSITTAPYGVVAVNVGADNVQTALAWGSGAAVSGPVVFEAGKKVWFEARVKVSSVTVSKHGAFIGFAEEALAVAAGVIADAGTLADKDLIGFFRIETGTTSVTPYFKTSGDGVAGGTAYGTSGVLAADTFTKLGIYCDGTTIHFYQDGVELGTGLALSTANVPDGEEMCLYIVAGGLAAEAHYVSVDWVKLATQRA